MELLLSCMFFQYDPLLWCPRGHGWCSPLIIWALNAKVVFWSYSVTAHEALDSPVCLTAFDNVCQTFHSSIILLSLKGFFLQFSSFFTGDASIQKFDIFVCCLHQLRSSTYSCFILNVCHHPSLFIIWIAADLCQQGATFAPWRLLTSLLRFVPPPSVFFPLILHV